MPQQSIANAQGDATLLLTIKEAEANALRQQIAQLSGDLKRNAAVLSTKDEETANLQITVDALRSLLTEKDNLFVQYQAQVQELELLRIKEAEQRAVLEKLLVQKESEWQQQQQTMQQTREAELDQLQQHYKEAGDQLSLQLMQARQAALDEAFTSSTNHQAALDRAAENGGRLQQQVDTLTSALQVKEAELQAAHRQLAAALDSTQELEVAHGKAVNAKDALILQLRQQLDQQAVSIKETASEHDANMSKLIGSISQMQQSCQAQAQEVAGYAATQKRLQEERKVLKEQLAELESVVQKLQTEKGTLESALQHEVTAQATAQAQLNIFQAKLSEAVGELERRCSAAEARSSNLMAQLVEERGRLVDAVIEQANSSTPQLAAELTKSLEVERVRTQTELQLAQERSQALAEELALIRTTLVPLLAAQGGVASAASGSSAQPANGALAALAQVKAIREHQRQQAAIPAPTNIIPGAALDHAYACCSVYASSPTVAAAADVQDSVVSRQPTQQQSFSPLRSSISCGPGNPGPGAAWCLPTASPAAGGNRQKTCLTLRQPLQHSPAAAAADNRRSGSLAGLVSDLQADVDKLQQQLHHSVRQLKWQKHAACMGWEGTSCTGAQRAVATAVGSPGLQGHISHSNSPSDTWQQQHQGSDATADNSRSPCNSKDTASPHQQACEALRYLLHSTEKLAQENEATKSQLSGQAAPSHTRVQLTAHTRPSRKVQTPENCMHQQGCCQHEHLQQHSQRAPLAQSREYNSVPSAEHKGSCHDRQSAVAALGTRGLGLSTADIEYDGTSSSVTATSDAEHAADELSIAAEEGLAAAQAIATLRCSRRRQEAHFAAPGVRQKRRPGRPQHTEAATHMTARQCQLDSQRVGTETLDYAASVSDSSECSVEQALPATVTQQLGHSSAATSRCTSSRQLLEMLAELPSSSRVGRLLGRPILSAHKSSNCQRTAHSSSHDCYDTPAECLNRYSRTHSTRQRKLPQAGVLAQQQLLRLAELSPTRRRLLTALADSC